MGAFSIIAWALTALLGYVFVKALIGLFGGAGDAQHCMACGTEGPTKTETRGSIWIEIVLWLCFIVPGLIYSIWRMTSRRQVCGTCGAPNVIPCNSPAAASHRKALSSA